MLTASFLDKKDFEVVGEIKAGDAASIHLKSGQAVRIFTGAAVPKGADAIVIQEKLERINGSIHFTQNFVAFIVKHTTWSCTGVI